MADDLFYLKFQQDTVYKLLIVQFFINIESLIKAINKQVTDT